jgi:hypothetical protein
MKRSFADLCRAMRVLMRARLHAAGCSLIVQDYSLSYDCTVDETQLMLELQHHIAASHRWCSP